MLGNPQARDLYVQRITQYDVALESGDCAAGTPGDSSWFVTHDPPAASMLRSGCFVNENEHANVRLTCLPNFGDVPGMYVGVLGASDDLAGLYDWAWGDAEWREYVYEFHVVYPDEPHGPQPAICHEGWFER
jgi:hypothetical protein